MSFFFQKVNANSESECIHIHFLPKSQLLFYLFHSVKRKLDDKQYTNVMLLEGQVSLLRVAFFCFGENLKNMGRNEQNNGMRV